MHCTKLNVRTSYGVTLALSQHVRRIVEVREFGVYPAPCVYFYDTVLVDRIPCLHRGSNKHGTILLGGAPMIFRMQSRLVPTAAQSRCNIRHIK